MSNIPEDDYQLTPCGHLGGRTAVSQYGKCIGEFPDNSAALAHVSAHMEANKFWPGIWWVSDHGNAWQIDKDGNEIASNPVEVCLNCHEAFEDTDEDYHRECYCSESCQEEREDAESDV